MQDIYITEIIDISLLQRLQDSFAKMNGVVAITLDKEGVPVTKKSGHLEFCVTYGRKAKDAYKQCQRCSDQCVGCVESLAPASFICSAGLIQFAAPIIVGDYYIGTLVAGKFLTEEMDDKAMEVLARKSGIEYVELKRIYEDVPKWSVEQTDDFVGFLADWAKTFSDIARVKIQAVENSRETERLANMKTDFLANMSHEIRTPMNAVIGMAEMALREEISDSARDYISQIKSSGAALLNIINDILDFSKIESGKMDIVPDEYEPISLFHDMTNIVMTRVQDKPVEILMSINPDMPCSLYGDSLRIRQILINIVNNAVKFTNKGNVTITVDYQKKNEKEIELIVAVKDTGIGIQKKDLDKIFESFQQVDSKRNRNIEGSGLGLAITQRLLELMGGRIALESVYGSGSTFTIYLPQKVMDWKKCISVSKPEEILAIGYFDNRPLAKLFYDDLYKLGVQSVALIAPDRYDTLMESYKDDLKKKHVVLFSEEKQFEEELSGLSFLHPDIHFVVLTDFHSSRKKEDANIAYLKKPLSTIGLGVVLNGDEELLHRHETTFEFNFIAPDARILAVDDNEVNLTVTEGLLEPLKMNITKATSGEEALKCLEKGKFDIVFMDHMMPDMDGVETTRIIRRLHPSLSDMPIIALTANAVGNAKKLFLSEGMNDFVAKPIELRNLVAKIRQWLPSEKIVFRQPDEVEETPEIRVISVADLDVESALRMLGSEKLFWTVLKKYYDAIEDKAALIKEYEMQEDITKYTVEVHALKSSSKQIGAMEVALMAEQLENAGNENNITFIHERTNELLERYYAYLDALKPYLADKDVDIETTPATAEILTGLFTKMREALDNLDMDGMEETIEEMKHFSYEGNAVEYFEELSKASGSIDVDACEEIIEKWSKEL